MLPVGCPPRVAIVLGSAREVLEADTRPAFAMAAPIENVRARSEPKVPAWRKVAGGSAVRSIRGSLAPSRPLDLAAVETILGRRGRGAADRIR